MRDGDTDVYLIWHPDSRVYKVGICARANDRLRQHQRHGWTVVGRIEFDRRSRAEKFERSVILRWRANGWGIPTAADAVLKRWNDDAGGLTECVSAADAGSWRQVWEEIVGMNPRRTRVVIDEVHCPLCERSDMTGPAHDAVTSALVVYETASG